MQDDELQKIGGRTAAAVEKKEKEMIKDEKCGGYVTGGSDLSLTEEEAHIPDPDANAFTDGPENFIRYRKDKESPSRSRLPDLSRIPHFNSHQSSSILQEINDTHPGLLPHAVNSETSLEDVKQTQEALRIKHPSKADIETTSDDDENSDTVREQEGIDEKEAERVVHELLGKYTTLYD
ncbi:MAG: hypothetical protein Q9183_006101 [Haloplaca sp. 2 TL-2023]